MNKLFGLSILAVVLGFCLSAFPQLQTMMVTGELRTRAYYQEDVTDLDDSKDDNFGRIETRVRLHHLAELTDSVFMVITGEATGLWGRQMGEDRERGFSSGGTEGILDLPEGYVEFRNIKNTDWSARIGRQHLNFGRGLLISDAEKELSYDALLVTGDYPTWTISVAGAKLEESQTLESIRASLAPADDARDWNLYLVDVDWHAENILPLRVGGYVIYAEDEVYDIEPLVFGLRAIYAKDSWSLWGEAAYETGNYGDYDLSAFAVDVGGSFTFDTGTNWSPTVKVAYTYASGDDDPEDDDWEAFDPLGQYRYYGHALSPRMSNIHIFNAGVSVEPAKDWVVALDYYHYLQAERCVGPVGNPLLTDPGIMVPTNGADNELGDEIDFSVTYEYTPGVSAQALLAYFMPGEAYDSDDALEIRGEILVSF